ncbi:MAG: adenosylcobinamide-GDP ribazoletransferase [Gammaproteobacteria bacterium]
MPHPNLFLLALGFYTRLPSPQNLNYDLLPKSAVYLPGIGWLVGGISALSFYFADFIWPQSASAIVAIIAGIMATGAFHEDGFADVCDGFGGGYGKDRILAIMKDPLMGSYGALGLVLMISLKISLLANMPSAMVPFVLLTGHSLSRLMPLLLMRSYPYARTESSKSGGAVFKPEPADLAFAAVLAILPFVSLPVHAMAAVLPVLAANSLLGRYFFRHIGGYTGDCLGASQQIAETIFYLSIGAIWTFI